jgi:hypothetical protein
MLKTVIQNEDIHAPGLQRRFPGSPPILSDPDRHGRQPSRHEHRFVPETLRKLWKFPRTGHERGSPALSSIPSAQNRRMKTLPGQQTA